MLRSKLDDLDKAIVQVLSEDGRLSASEVALRIGEVSERTVRNRIAALLQTRSIVIGAIPDATALGREAQAELLIAVEGGKLDSVVAQLVEFEQVYFLAATSGKYALSASVMFATRSELLEFTEGSIASLPGVRNVVINVVLKLYKTFGTRTTTVNAQANVTALRNTGKSP